MQLREPSFRRKTYQGYTAKKVGLELSIVLLGFPGSTVVKNQPTNAEDTRDANSFPGSGRSPGGGTCRGAALVDPGNSKVGTASASLEIAYLITDREGLEN